MAGINTILTAVRALVAGVTGTTDAQVHDGVRAVDDEAAFRTLHRVAANTRLETWLCTWGGVNEEIVGQRELTIRDHEIRIIGFYAVDDPGAGTTMTSELAFRTVVEAICTALRQDRTLSGAVQQVMPPSVVDFGHRMLRGVLCHYAEIEFEVQERVSYVA